MSVQKHGESLYNDFLNYSYPELESLLLSAEDEDTREFYKRLCEFYVVKNQKRVMREKPF